MNHIKYLTLLAFLFLTENLVFAQSQTIVKGTVLDENSKPMQYVTIMATEQGKQVPYKGITTNDKGVFQLALQKGKKYTLGVFFIGYNRLTLPINTDSLSIQNMEEIKLTVEPVKLKEIVVRPMIEVSPDEIVYNITSDPERVKSNMLQIFQKVPLIHVMPDGRISVGDQDKKFIITRNGRIDALLNINGMSYDEVIRKLPAMGFTKVRVLTDPPKKYGEVQYVVDIVADNSVALWGIVGNDKLGYDMGPGVLDNTTSFSSSADIIRVSGGIGYSNISPPKNSLEKWLKTYSQNSILDQYQSNSSASDRYNSNLAMSVDITKKHYIYLTFGFNYSTSKSSVSSTSKKSIADSIVEKYNSEYVGHYTGRSWRGNISYQFDFKQSYRNLTISYLVTSNPSSGNTILKNYGILDYNNSSILTNKSTEALNHKFQIDYKDRLFKKIPMSIGLGYLNLNYNNSISSFNELNTVWLENLDGYSRQLRYNNIINGYMKLGIFNKKTISISTNLSANYLINGAGSKLIIKDLEQNIKEEVLILSPGMNMSYLFKEKSFIMALRFSYALTPLRPNLDQLSNYTDKTNPNFLKTGNPNLRPEIFHTLSLRLEDKLLSPQFIYNFSNNRIASFSFKNKEGQLVESYENANKFQMFHLGVAKVFMSKNGVFYIQSLFVSTYTNNKTSKGTTEGLGVMLYFSGSLKLNNNLFFTGNCNYSDNWEKGYSTSHNKQPFNPILGVRYSILKGKEPKWDIDLEANILDWNSGTTMHVLDPDFELRDINSTQRIPMSITIKYRFGKFKVLPIKKTKEETKISGFSDGNVPNVTM
jgi:hypothetical protein